MQGLKESVQIVPPGGKELESWCSLLRFLHQKVWSILDCLVHLRSFWMSGSGHAGLHKSRLPEQPRAPMQMWEMYTLLKPQVALRRISTKGVQGGATL